MSNPYICSTKSAQFQGLSHNYPYCQIVSTVVALTQSLHPKSVQQLLDEDQCCMDVSYALLFHSEWSLGSFAGYYRSSWWVGVAALSQGSLNWLTAFLSSRLQCLNHTALVPGPTLGPSGTCRALTHNYDFIMCFSVQSIRNNTRSVLAQQHNAFIAQK